MYSPYMDTAELANFLEYQDERDIKSACLSNCIFVKDNLYPDTELVIGFVIHHHKHTYHDTADSQRSGTVLYTPKDGSEMSVTVHCWLKHKDMILEVSNDIARLKDREYYCTVDRLIASYPHLGKHKKVLLETQKRLTKSIRGL